MATWWKGWRSRLTLLASALLVPLLVAGAFVWAGWQSSDRLHHNTGVVVNLDQTYTKGGHAYTLGNQLGAQLVTLSGAQYNWDFGVSPSQAQTGLASGRYNVAVVIPSNFSRALLSDGKERGVLAIQTSPLASVDQKVLAGTLAEAAQRGLARQLGVQALSGIYVTFDQVDKDLVVASNKASGAASSAVSLTTLAGTATKQATQVKQQTQQVATGSQQVANQATQANQSAQTATRSGNKGAAAAQQASSAAQQHQTQAGTAASGASQLGTGIADAGKGASTASSNAQAATDSANGLTAATTGIDSAAKGAQKTVTSYQDAVKAALAQQKALTGELAAIGGSAASYNADVTDFRTALQNWKTSVTIPGATGPGTINKDAANAAIKQLQQDVAALNAQGTRIAGVQASLKGLQTSFQSLIDWSNSTKEAVPSKVPDRDSTSHFSSLVGGHTGGSDAEVAAACQFARGYQTRPGAANQFWDELSRIEQSAGADLNAPDTSKGSVCRDFTDIVDGLVSKYNDALQGVPYDCTSRPRNGCTDIAQGFRTLVHDAKSGRLVDASSNENQFLSLYTTLMYVLLYHGNNDYDAGYLDGYPAGYGQARTEVQTLVKNANLANAQTVLNQAISDLNGFDTTAVTRDAKAAQSAVDGMTVTPGQKAPDRTVTITGDDAVKAAAPAYAKVQADQKALATALDLAVGTDATSQKAARELASSTDPATIQKDLAVVLKSNASEASQIQKVAASLGTVKGSLTTLTTSIAAAQAQAQAVAQQTVATASGAAALAKQISALQSTLKDVSGAGAGTAAQTQQVAQGAQQLSQSASGAAQAASGLSNTVTRVGQQSKDVSNKTRDTATSVKGTSTTVSNQTAHQPNTTQTVATATTNSARHPNIAWWSPLVTMAMWLGAMTMYMLFRPISQATRGSGASPMALVAEVLAPGVIIGAVQAFIMAIASWRVMHLGFGETLETFGVLLLMSAAFMAVNFVLAALFGVFGRMVSVMFALITGVGVVTNALPEVFDEIRGFSPMSPALDAVRSIAAGAPGTDAAVGHLLLWTAGSIALAGLLILRARVAEAPRVATALT